MASMNARSARHVARRSRATRQRGAALLEAVVVAGACLGLLGLGLAVHGREVTRLEREREVRSMAWQQALAGCVEPDRVAALTRAALQGRATAAAERLARAGDRRAHEPGRVPCNEPSALESAEPSNAPTSLEHHLLPRLP